MLFKILYGTPLIKCKGLKCFKYQRGERKETKRKKKKRGKNKFTFQCNPKTRMLIHGESIERKEQEDPGRSILIIAVESSTMLS